MTGCVLVAHTVSACRHGEALSRDSLLTPRVREPRSNKQTCAGNISAGPTFRPTVGLDSDPARASCSGPLRAVVFVPLGVVLSKYRANLRCSVPCGVVASVPLPCIQHGPLAKWQPPVAENMSTISAISAGQGEEKSFFDTPIMIPGSRQSERPETLTQTFDTPPPIAPPKSLAIYHPTGDKWQRHAFTWKP